MYWSSNFSPHAAARGGYAGLDQVNVVPRDLIGKAEVPIVLTVDGKQANSVTAALNNGCFRPHDRHPGKLLAAPIAEAIVVAIAVVARVTVAITVSIAAVVPVVAYIRSGSLLAPFVLVPLAALLGTASIIAAIVTVAITVVVSIIITIPRGRRLRKCDR
jgi:hypothetical protein